MNEELKPCPFCGCNMKIYHGTFPNGDEQIEPYGLHNGDCPLYAVSWHTYPEDGWTEEKIAERWNRRVGEKRMSEQNDYPKKYVVIYEIDTGYMDCIAICDKAEEAYGHAYLQLGDGLEEGSYYITLPERREGDNGYIIECRDKADDKLMAWCTVLFYREEGGTE